MDAEIDTALAVLLFCFGEPGEGARHERADVALIVLGHAIELIRDEGKRNAIGSEEAAQSLEQRRAERRHVRTGRPGTAG